MIIALLLQMLFTVLNIAFFFVDPITELPLGMGVAIGTIYSLVHAGVDVFPPLGLALVFMFAGLTIEFGYFTYKIVRSIVNLIRGAG